MDTQDISAENPKRSRFGEGWSLFKKSFSYLFENPVFLVPIFICWLIVVGIILYLRYYWVGPESIGLMLLSIYGFVFLIAYTICLANLVLLELMNQREEKRPISLWQAFGETVSFNAVRAIPIAIFYSIVWFIIILLRALTSRKKDRSKAEPSLKDAALTLGGINANPFSWIRLGLRMLEKLLRMTIFLALPAIAWENKGSFSAFGKAVEIIKQHPVQFLTTYALTGISALIMALPLVPIMVANEAELELPGYIWLAIIIYEGIIWTLGMYLEQMSVASLYLLHTKQKEVEGLEVLSTASSN